MAKTTSIKASIKLRENKYVVIYHRNQLFRTGITIDTPDEFKNGQLTSRYKGKEDYREMNLLIQQKHQLINRLISEAGIKGVDTLDYVNAHFNTEQRKLMKLKLTSKTTLTEAYEEYVKIKKNKLKDFTEDRSFQRYLSEVSRLKDYEKVCPSTLSDLVDIDWFHDFIRYLAKPSTKKIEVYNTKTEQTYSVTKNMQQGNSTISRFLQDLITFLKSVQLNSELKFPIQEIIDLNKSLLKPSDDSDNIIVMTKAQWNAFKKYKPREKYEWEVDTYNLFRFATNVGMRFCDCIRLNDDYVNQDNVISMQAQKTRGRFTVPMNEDALAIYEKYGRDFRKVFKKNQRININLEKILKRIPEFCDTVITHDYNIGVTERRVKSFDLIKFHASRRTFVSFSIKNNARLDQIKAWTGWKDLRVLNHYWNVFKKDEEKNNDLLVLNF